MQLTPRYDGEPVMTIDAVIDDPATPLLRQRERFASVLADLTEDQWAAASRCEGWSVQDVVSHLVTTNQFWALSVTSGAQRAPTRFLTGFDPVATPAQLVDAIRTWTPTETLDRFVESNHALAAAFDGLDDEAWSYLAEAPPGHIAVRLLALHALWDCWVHERDVVLPLGLTPIAEVDEIAASLVYAAALGPAFLALSGSHRTGTLEVHTTAPDLRVVIELGPSVRIHDGAVPAGTVTITGDAVALIEALSFRGPFPAPLAENDRWLLGNLGEVFDQVG